jgi:poly-gamma-glutamate synthesis protein (capsule biosynthesis protein)
MYLRSTLARPVLFAATSLALLAAGCASGGSFTAALPLGPTPPAAAPAGATPAPPTSTTTTTSTTAVLIVPSTTTTSSTAPTTSTTTTTTMPPLPPLTIAFAGDTSFTHGLQRHDPLAEATPLLSAPDLMIVNLETTVAEPGVGSPLDKEFVFKSPPESVDLLRDAGIDAVSLANNHTLDYGRPALERTLELLEEGGVAYSGAGRTEEEAYAPLYLEAAGRTVALVALSRVPCGWSGSGKNWYPEVAWTCNTFRDRAAAAVSEAAANADVVAVMVHWGIERDHCPQPYQRDLATQWAAAGADVVIGGHPHVLQGIEKIGSTWLVNSAGNFAFPSARDTSSYSAIFEFTFTEDEAPSLRVHPMRVGGGITRVPDEAGAQRSLDLIQDHSFGWALLPDGTAVPSNTDGRCGS